MRGRLAFAAAALVVLTAGLWWWLRPAVYTLAPVPERNILLVTIDTLRADAVGA